MKPREYCCCAIPIVNAGIYATLTEQLVLGILVGALSVATPSIVGAATPSFAPWILGIVCFVGAAVQVLGFIGVAREKSILYRRYVTLHILLTTAAFAIAVAWIITSALRHTTAQTSCETTFFNGTAGSATSSEGETLCNIFAWVDVGIMGGLWIVLAIAQIYLYVVISSYGTTQRRDHKKYNSFYGSANPLTTDGIAMTTVGDPWDSRNSTESVNINTRPDGYGHVRQESGASVSDVMSDQYQQPRDALSDPNYGYTQGSYPPAQTYPNRRPSHQHYPSQTANAYTNEAGPPVNYDDSRYGRNAPY